jgi:SNF2 family DNA or RNA helicase
LKPKIFIHSSADNMIYLKKSSGIDYKLWESVVFWWSDLGISENDIIKIPVNEFLNRASWLRSRWIKDGGAVEIDEPTKKLLSLARNEYDDFKNIITNTPEKIEPFSDIYLKRKLTDFQKIGVARLKQLKSGANFSVPGAGKTTMTLALWSALVNEEKISKLLVVCPKSAFDAWIHEPKIVLNNKIKSWVFDYEPLDTAIDILIVNFEKLENEESLIRIKKWLLESPTMLVIDEAHRIKGGQKSIRWRRCKRLASYAARVDLLTGTPMPQDFDDLRNLFAITWPNVPRTFLTDSLFSSMKRNSVYVRTTKDELKLPPVIIKPTLIKMGVVQKEIYSALCKAYVGMFSLSTDEKSYFGAKGRAVMNLLAASSNPGLLAKIVTEDAYLGLEWPPREIANTDSLVELVSRYASIEMPPKYKWIRERCEKVANEGGKVLIWSTLVGNIRALSKILKPLNPAVVYGAVSNDDRKVEIDKFRNDPSCSVLISNPQTLGEGISLHKECHEAIYLDRSYNAGHYLQSLDRIHRLGLSQEQSTIIHILITEYTIDQSIANRLEEKIQNLSLALNDEGLLRNSLPDENALLPDEVLGIDQYDLNDLFLHLNNYD